MKRIVLSTSTLLLTIAPALAASELPADLAGLEFQGAAVSVAGGDFGLPVGVPGGAARELMAEGIRKAVRQDGAKRISLLLPVERSFLRGAHTVKALSSFGTNCTLECASARGR
jgi:hypothetical protein